MNEELYEEGIVSGVEDGVASVILNESAACSSCAVKTVCKPGEDDLKILTARDPFGVKPGDHVRISVKGKNVLAAAFLLYGIPLILFLAGIFIGMPLFRDQKELYGTIMGFVFIAVYLLFLKLLANRKKNKNKMMPEIVFVNSKLE